ncbi:alpha/beta hydrolase [Sphingobacterium sp. LRF_L2]|uniref:alpha/beta hydrolase n=1 Tax=Sphingobacterium sp. LRF_L2 TaxID=3369421 RepID=UPI003F5DC3EC
MNRRKKQQKRWTILGWFIIATLHSAQASVVKDSLYSNILHENRSLLLSLPASYNDSDLQETNYPVIYLLDGAENFKSVEAMHHYLAQKRFPMMPEAIIVGIPNTNRTRDLTPSLVPPVEGDSKGFKEAGGLTLFTKFIKEELFPHMNARYRTAPFNILIGHSFGGLAATDILIQQTTMFNAYIIIEPSLWWNSHRIANQAEKTLATEQCSDRNIFVALASNIVYNNRQQVHDEHHNAIKKFGEQTLPNSRIPSHRWHFKYYPDDDHGTIPIPATYDAFKFLFKEIDLPVKSIIKNPAILQQSYDRLAEQLGYTFLPSQQVYIELIRLARDRNQPKEASILLDQAKKYYPESKAIHKL